MKFGLTQETYNLIKEVIKNNPKYKFKIFGSRAKGTYKQTSDIDIAVFENVSKEDKFKIENELDKLNIIYKIDLVFVNKNTKVELLKSIELEGEDF
ncbi:MAG: nucleotidyltransferase domain-containing protein [Clostridia bacterium]|nr:nucleotidyltransferase domain-containing protein [Clostridia bacterium]